MKLTGQWLILFCLLGYVSLVKADEDVIWGYGQFPPYIQSQDGGQPRGPFVDIVDKVFSHAGLSYQAILAPNRRARKGVNDGSLQFAITALSALDNPNDFYLSKHSVAKIDLRVFWLKQQTPIYQINDLKDKSVILIASYYYSGLRKFIENPDNQIEVAVNVEDHRRALSALKLQRGEYMLGYKLPVELAQKDMNLPELGSIQVMQTDVYFVMSKSVNNARQLMDRLDSSYAALYLQGQN